MRFPNILCTRVHIFLLANIQQDKVVPIQNVLSFHPLKKRGDRLSIKLYAYINIKNIYFFSWKVENLKKYVNWESDCSNIWKKGNSLSKNKILRRKKSVIIEIRKWNFISSQLKKSELQFVIASKKYTYTYINIKSKEEKERKKESKHIQISIDRSLSRNHLKRKEKISPLFRFVVANTPC